MTGGLLLHELSREIPGFREIVGDETVRALGISQDSRKVSAGDLFAIRRGATTSGAVFAAEAIRRGAVALLVEPGLIEPSSVGVPVILVDRAALALAHAAAAIYGHPTFAMDVVGITGTNGKTTVAHLARAAIDGALGGDHAGLIGTVGSQFGDLSLPSTHTTPESDDLARILAEMRRRGATHVCMEVSSHALALERVQAVHFRVAAFTNLSQDHLDFHGTMERYQAEKEKLFFELGPGVSVVNVDDPFGASLASRAKGPLLRVSARPGPHSPEADVFPLHASATQGGIDATFRTPSGEARVHSRLVGAHNLENLAVALGIAEALALNIPRVAAALSDAMGAPGRLERCDAEGDDITVLVDYAHTPDALVRVLEAVRAISKGRIVTVFGCGGDRDKKKRLPMGEAVGHGSDLAIVTNDNPRSEDPAAIADEIVPGLELAGGRPVTMADLASAPRGFVVELDRRKAIRLAIQNAAPGDIVLLAGKGHETYQVLGNMSMPFDDRVEAVHALAERRATHQARLPTRDGG